LIRPGGIGVRERGPAVNTKALKTKKYSKTRPTEGRETG
jgi:hypothetical protein